MNALGLPDSSVLKQNIQAGIEADPPHPPTGGEFIAMAASEFGVAPKYRVLSRPILRLVGCFSENAQLVDFWFISAHLLFDYGQAYRQIDSLANLSINHILPYVSFLF